MKGGAACIIILNKWDLIEKVQFPTIGKHVMHVKDSLKYLDFAPIITVSALSGQRLRKVFDLIDNVYDQYHKKEFSTSLLNTKLAEFTERPLSPALQKQAQ